MPRWRGFNRQIARAISNDARPPERQKPDSAHIQHRDPICLPRSGKEVPIRHLSYQIRWRLRWTKQLWEQAEGNLSRHHYRHPNTAATAPHMGTMHLLCLRRADRPSFWVTLQPEGAHGSVSRGPAFRAAYYHRATSLNFQIWQLMALSEGLKNARRNRSREWTAHLIVHSVVICC